MALTLLGTLSLAAPPPLSSGRSARYGETSVARPGPGAAHNDALVSELSQVHGSDFEVVRVPGLVIG